MSNEIALLNKDIKRFKGVVANLSKENKKLKAKLEQIKQIMNILNNVGYYKDLEKTVLQIIEGAEE